LDSILVSIYTCLISDKIKRTNNIAKVFITH
jgi:hypothetical protein